MIRASRLLTLTLVLHLGALGVLAVEPARKFRAGAATSNITPRFGISINGSMSDRKAGHIHDELHARCLVLDDGQTTLAIAVCDSVAIVREVMDEAKRIASEASGIPVEHILVSATHSHSCGAAASVFSTEADPEYQKFLALRIADGIRRARNNLEPARIGWTAGSVPGQVFNRRWRMKPGVPLPNPLGGFDQVKMNPGIANPDLLAPAGPTDPEVPLISVRSPEGRPIALLANYSLHYVGGTGPGHISADYFGAFCERLQALLQADRLDPPFVPMMSNGTSGDINNINFRGSAPKRKPYEKIREVADEVATEVFRAGKSIEYRDWALLGARRRELTLGVRRPDPAELQRAKEILAATQGRALNGPHEVYARETVLMSEYPAEVPVIIQAFRIGDLGIAQIPCEVFVEIGFELKKRSPFQPAFTIELANGYNGYLPTPEQHRLGGYETWRARSSYLEVDAATKITATVLELFASLRRSQEDALKR